MEAIVTYSEVTLTGKRKYELYPDKIVMRGSGTWSYDFEQTLPLTKISADYGKLRMRPPVTWISLTIFLLTGLLSIVLVREFAIQSRAIPGVLGILSGSALIVAIATMKKVEYAQFCAAGYGSVLLSVARSGPERDRFDSFVRALVSQIEYANKLKQGADLPF
jgi:hypothetical protein